MLLDDLMWVEKRAWPKELQAPVDAIKTRLDFFPRGVATVKEDGKIVAFSTAMLIQYDPESPPETWEDTTASGWIIGNHDPEGNALYLVSVAVAEDYRRQGYGSKLLDMQKELARKMKLEYVVLGSRVPTASLSEDPIEEVVEKDPEIRFYKRNGFRVVKITENYMFDDPESCNWGVVMDCRL